MVLLVRPLRLDADANGALKFTLWHPAGCAGPGRASRRWRQLQGMVDATTDLSQLKSGTAIYVNTGNGASSWTGLSNVSVNDRLIWNDNTNVWDVISPPPVTGVDLNYVASPGQGARSRTQPAPMRSSRQSMRQTPA